MRFYLQLSSKNENYVLFLINFHMPLIVLFQLAQIVTPNNTLALSYGFQSLQNGWHHSLQPAEVDMCTGI